MGTYWILSRPLFLRVLIQLEILCVCVVRQNSILEGEDRVERVAPHAVVRILCVCAVFLCVSVRGRSVCGAGWNCVHLMVGIRCLCRIGLSEWANMLLVNVLANSLCGALDWEARASLPC